MDELYKRVLRQIQAGHWFEEREAARALCTPSRARCILTRKTNRLQPFEDYLAELEERDHEHVPVRQ